MNSMNNISLVLVKFMFISLLFDLKVLSQDCNEFDKCDCGTAARPLGSEIIVKQNNTIENYDPDKHFKHNSHIWYQCEDKNNVLVGDATRKCDRGKWLGNVPRCAINYLNQTELSSIKIVDYKKSAPNSTINVKNRYNDFGAFTPPIAQHPNNCLKWKISQHHNWLFRLKYSVDIHYIRIKLYGQNSRNHWNGHEIRFEVFLNNLRGIKCKLSNTNPISHEGNDDNKNMKNLLTLEFLCESNSKMTEANKIHTIHVNFTAEKNMKMSVLSLCDLRVYYFPKSCGEPDFPVSTQVRESYLSEEFLQYEFICRDNDHMLEGNTHIRCGPYGKWMYEFPICVSKSYCELLKNDSIGNALSIAYESTVKGEDGTLFVPNGKMAQFSCNSPDAKKNNETVYHLHGISRIICQNGEWHGLSLNEKPNCVLKDSVSTGSFTISISKQIIRILCGILIVCLISIVCLIIYMLTVRKSRHKRKMKEIKSRMLNNSFKVNYETYDDISEYNNFYESNINDYDYICNDFLQDNPLYRDDLSVGTECHKTNSIYSV